MAIEHRPKYIPGVYNFCDRWCERCRFQTRCRVFRDRRVMEDARTRGLSDDEAQKLLEEDDDDEPQRPMTASERLDWETFLAEVNRPPTPEEEAATEERMQRIDALVKRDPLAIASRECDDLAFNLIRLLRPIVEARTDPVISAALETISWFTYIISVKTRRAVRGWAEAKEEERDSDDVDEDRYVDANGTAKLVRLCLRESRDAWAVLMQAGLGDGAPAKMIDRLERLDDMMAERFPRAMAFVRPGWDD